MLVTVPVIWLFENGKEIQKFEQGKLKGKIDKLAKYNATTGNILHL